MICVETPLGHPSLEHQFASLVLTVPESFAGRFESQIGLDYYSWFVIDFTQVLNVKDLLTL